MIWREKSESTKVSLSPGGNAMVSRVKTMESFTEENYVGLKEYVMDLKVALSPSCNVRQQLLLESLSVAVPLSEGLPTAGERGRQQDSSGRSSRQLPTTTTTPQLLLSLPNPPKKRQYTLRNKFWQTFFKLFLCLARYIT